jgi:hypothetical protein
MKIKVVTEKEDIVDDTVLISKEGVMYNDELLPCQEVIELDGMKVYVLHSGGIDQSKTSFPIRVDLIISDLMPLCFEPPIIRDVEEDYDAWNERLRLRKYITTAFENIRTSYWVSGGVVEENYSKNYGNLFYKNLINKEEIEL